MDSKNVESVDDNEAERLNRLQVACALRDAVGDFIAGTREEDDDEGGPSIRLQRINLKENFLNPLASTSENSRAVADCEQRFCGHKCAHHTALMNPVLWGRLPSDILHLVFAYLPLPDVLNVVPKLSKEWKRRMEEKSPEFRWIRADASRKMFGLVAQNMNVPGKFWARLYDLDSSTWHVIEIVAADWEPYNTMCAAVGGLVCFVCSSPRKPRYMPIVVANPLTGDIWELPLHSVELIPKMVQIVVDRNTKSYQVVMGDINFGLTTDAEVFHSDAGVWTSTSFSLVPFFFGYSHSFYGSENVLLPSRFCVYDCADEKLFELEEPDDDRQRKHSALVHDRLFILWERVARDETTRWVSEFQVCKHPKHEFRKLRDSHCKGLTRCPQSSRDYDTAHYACKDFVLVVFETNSEFRYRQSRQYLFDLATGEWHDLPPLPQGETIVDDHFMCELRWDIIP